MGHFCTHFSCTLDVGTPANVQRALEIFENSGLRDDPDYPLSSGLSVSIDEAGSGTVLWLHHEGDGNSECIIAFVLLCAEAFDLTGLWGFEYANSCSRPTPDAHGGGAHVLDLGARRSVCYVYTNEWLAIALNGGDPDV